MYKVMLAEDEAEVLGAMLKTIHWENYGFEVPIGCRDGAEAIRCVEAGEQPDVLITDICMPFVDGLELTEYVTKHLPDAIVVILTGYDDFHYAQKAIKFQVFDYVLKPITPSCLCELLERLKVELDQRSRSDGNSKEIVTNYFLNQLVHKKMDLSVISEYCRIYDIKFEGCYHVSALLDIDLPAQKTGAQDKSDDLLRYGLFNIAQELSQEYGVAVFQGREGLCNCIVSAADLESCFRLTGTLISHIAQTVHRALKVTVSAGIGEPVKSLDALYFSHQKAEKALESRFYYGENSILFSSEVDIKKSENIDYQNCERHLTEAVYTLNRTAAGDAVKELANQLKNTQAPLEKCVFYTQKLLMKMIMLADDIAGEQQADAMTKAFEGASLYSVSTLAQLVDRLDEMFDKAFEILLTLKTSSSASQVAKAELYIKEHFNNPELSLNSVTEHLSVSTSYFSSIFKERTGMTFVEYLTQLRMEKAKQLLTFTDYRTYEIAENIGFSDPHYFCVIFKRTTGLPPTEYREMHKNQP